MHIAYVHYHLPTTKVSEVKLKAASHDMTMFVMMMMVIMVMMMSMIVMPLLHIA